MVNISIIFIAEGLSQNNTLWLFNIAMENPL